jgi:hypothetical protein
MNALEDELCSSGIQMGGRELDYYVYCTVPLMDGCCCDVFACMCFLLVCRWDGTNELYRNT